MHMLLRSGARARMTSLPPLAPLKRDTLGGLRACAPWMLRLALGCRNIHRMDTEPFFSRSRKLEQKRYDEKVYTVYCIS